MTMTFDKLAKIVADEFCKMMAEDGFESFAEMAHANWWKTDDIKGVINDIIEDRGLFDCYIDEEDSKHVFCAGNMMEYRKFAAMFKKEIKNYSCEWIVDEEEC